MQNKTAQQKEEVSQSINFSSIARIQINGSNIDKFEGKVINVEKVYGVSTRYGAKIAVEGTVEGKNVSCMIGKTAVSFLLEQNIVTSDDMLGRSFKIGTMTIMGKKTIILEVVQ
jgi:hypothetical protein